MTLPFHAVASLLDIKLMKLIFAILLICLFPVIAISDEHNAHTGYWQDVELYEQQQAESSFSPKEIAKAKIFCDQGLVWMKIGEKMIYLQHGEFEIPLRCKTSEAQ